MSKLNRLLVWLVLSLVGGILIHQLLLSAASFSLPLLPSAAAALLLLLAARKLWRRTKSRASKTLR